MSALEGERWLFEEMSDRAIEKGNETLADALASEPVFRREVIERLQRIERLLDRVLKQVENRM